MSLASGNCPTSITQVDDGVRWWLELQCRGVGACSLGSMAPLPRQTRAGEDDSASAGRAPKRARLDYESASIVKKPTLPPAEEDLKGRVVMKVVITWVMQELPGYLQKHRFATRLR